MHIHHHLPLLEGVLEVGVVKVGSLTKASLKVSVKSKGVIIAQDVEQT